MSGEYLSSSETKRGFVTYVSEKTGKIKTKELELSVINNRLVFEGDIVVGTTGPSSTAAARPSADTPETQPPEPVIAGVIITGTKYRWPNATIPYVIHEDLPNTKRVTDAIKHWEDNTPIKFVVRDGETDYVRFIPSDGCWSYVGRQGGRQDIGLAGGCGTGNTIHEIGHAVGMWHEQSREDRDDFVTIHWDNIVEDKEHNFNQHIADGDDIGNYDYGSIMHYSRTAFSTNGDTITPPEGVTIGQRLGLSDGDIAAVVYMYGNGELYIGNKRTKEFHVWNCQWVRLMSPRNKVRFWAIERPLISGYNGCYYCMQRWDTG